MVDIRYEARAYGRSDWVNVTPRIGREVVLTEGRDPGTIGSGTPKPRPSVMLINFDNSDNYFTNYISGRVILPGANIRMLWNNETRSIGVLASRSVEQDGSVNTEWHGQLAKITSGRDFGGPRLFINKTPQAIFEIMALTAGIPYNDIFSDAVTDTYSRKIRPGINGLIDIEDAFDAIVYDSDDGSVRMELPATRAGKVVSQRYTDMAPNADEVAISKPQNLLRSWGVVNYAEAIVELYAPKSGDAESVAFRLPGTSLYVTAGYTDNATITFDTRGIISNDATITYSLKLKYRDNESAEFTDATFDWTIVAGTLTMDINIRNLVVSHDETSVTVRFDYFGSVDDNLAGATADEVEIVGTVTIANSHSIEYDTVQFPEPYTDQISFRRFGHKPRDLPVIVGLALNAPAPENYDLPVASREVLEEIARAETKKRRDPLSVYKVLHADDDDAIESRRISDKEHLRLEDGTDGDYFVDALETRISTIIRQTAWYAAAERPRTPIYVEPGDNNNLNRFPTHTRGNEYEFAITDNTGTNDTDLYHINYYEGVQRELSISQFSRKEVDTHQHPVFHFLEVEDPDRAIRNADMQFYNDFNDVLADSAAYPGATIEFVYAGVDNPVGTRRVRLVIADMVVDADNELPYRSQLTTRSIIPEMPGNGVLYNVPAGSWFIYDENDALITLTYAQTVDFYITDKASVLVNFWDYDQRVRNRPPGPNDIVDAHSDKNFVSGKWNVFLNRYT